MKNEKNQWEEAYKNRNNFVFYPHEEVIRFFSKYITKRIGFNEFADIAKLDHTPRVLDLGCGIGRHIIFSNQMKAEAYGADLSETAIAIAKEWAKKEGISDIDDKIVQSDITKMPFSNGLFDFMVSHGVLDSMSEECCRLAVAESSRVLKHGGLFYCDLISGEDSFHATGFKGEEIVTGAHEKGTIQLYFDRQMIRDIFEPYYKIVEIITIRKTSEIANQFISRFHLILENK